VYEQKHIINIHFMEKPSVHLISAVKGNDVTAAFSRIEKNHRTTQSE